MVIRKQPSLKPVARAARAFDRRRAQFFVVWFTLSLIATTPFAVLMFIALTVFRLSSFPYLGLDGVGAMSAGEATVVVCSVIGVGWAGLAAGLASVPIRMERAALASSRRLSGTVSAPASSVLAAPQPHHEITPPSSRRPRATKRVPSQGRAVASQPDSAAHHRRQPRRA